MPGTGLTPPITPTLILLNDPQNPTIANQPTADVQTNITMLYNYLLHDGGGSGIVSAKLAVSIGDTTGQFGSYYLDLNNATNTLLTANFNDASHGNRSGGSLHTAATESAAGFMSAADKTKLDGLGGPYTLPPATASTVGGVIIPASSTSGLNVAIDGTLTLALPNATTSTIGGVIIGGGLSVTSGTVSLNTSNLALLNAANTFTMTQTAPAFNATSARALKTNIRDIDPASLNLMALASMQEWDWTKESGYSGHAMGTMADSVAEVLPLVVGYDDEGAAASIDYGRLAYLMVSALIRQKH